MVPTGTFNKTSSPSHPLQFEPSPWRPRSALYSGLKRKWTRVLWRSLDSIITSPPSPPSPPDGPPRGTYFSLRKAIQPFPPSPAFTRIVASSMNIKNLDFLCVPSCPLWFKHLNFINHEGHEGTQRKPKQESPTQRRGSSNRVTRAPPPAWRC